MQVITYFAKLGLCVDTNTKQTATSHETLTNVKKHSIGDVILYNQAKKCHEDARPDQHARKGVGDFVFYIEFFPPDVSIFVAVY